MLEFTENHRYVTCRDFALSGLDRKVLAELYQPMVGPVATALYLLLYHHTADDAPGYSAAEQQRRLFLGLGLEMNPAGRRRLAEQASRLEAVGLLQVFRQYDPVAEETLYEYALQRPLAPAEFFANPHLMFLLRDQIGKFALLDLRRALVPQRPETLERYLNREELTVPFYDIFKPVAGESDPELEAALAESAPAREAAEAVRTPERIRHADMLLRFPRSSPSRRHVERLHLAPEAMALLNYIAYKYELDVPEICRLLSEDDMFLPDGTLHEEELRRRASQLYRQDRKRGEERARYLGRGESLLRRGAADAEEPAGGAGEADGYGAAAGSEGARETGGTGAAAVYFSVPKSYRPAVPAELYNEMLRREPYTRLLQRFFPGAVPDLFHRVFEKIDLVYKLPEPVINVLIHYVFSMDDAQQRLSDGFIDSIASNMLAKGVRTFEQAVVYVREQEKLNAMLEQRRRGEGAREAPGAAGRGRGAAPKRKPAMPVAEAAPMKTLTPEEREKMRERARRLKDR